LEVKARMDVDKEMRQIKETTIQHKRRFENDNFRVDLIRKTTFSCSDSFLPINTSAGRLLISAY
jgi:hypothetical protein